MKSVVVPACIALTVLTLLPAASAAISGYADHKLGEAGSLGVNNLPQDGSGNGRHLVTSINGTGAFTGSTDFHLDAANSSSFLDTSAATNEGWYASGQYNSLPVDNFAFGVFARAASTGANEGDVFTVGGSNGSFKLSLAGNGWAASAHNVAWIGGDGGVSGSFSPNTWVHLALVRSGGQTTFYINGLPQGAAYPGVPVNDTPHLSVSPGGATFFDGQFDEARVVTFDDGEPVGDVIAALQVGARIPSAFVQEGANGAFLAAGLSTDQVSSFRLGGAVQDFVKVTLADRFSVVAGTAPSHALQVLVQGDLTVGSYPLIDYAGSIGGLGFGGLALSPLPGRLAGALVNDTVNSAVLLNITVAPANDIVWTGLFGSAWDQQVTANWKFADTGLPTAFYALDNVLFDDTAATGGVALSGLLEPNTVLIDNPLRTYTFSGTGIGGAGRLDKFGAGTLVLSNPNSFSGVCHLHDGTVRIEGESGAPGGGAVINDAILVVERTNEATIANAISGNGTFEKRGSLPLTLSGNNSYHGDTTVSTGTLKSGRANCLGSAIGITTVATGATLDVHGTGFGNEAVVIHGSGSAGAGAVVNSGGERLNGLVSLTLGSDAAIGGSNRWDVRGGGSTVGGNFLLTKTGPNQISFVQTAVTVRDIDVAGGFLTLEYGTACDDTNPGRISVKSGAALGFGDFGLAVAVSKPIQLDGGSLYTTSTGANGNATVTAPVAFNAAASAIRVESGATLVCNGEVSGTGGLEKTGGGVLVLGGSNSYSGETRVDAGTLTLTQASLANSGTVFVATGATVNLAHGVSDIVGGIVFGSDIQAAGTYSAATHPTFLAGGGSLVILASGPTFGDWIGSFPALTDPADKLPGADPDGDGIANGVEFVVGNDPAVAASVNQPVASVVGSNVQFVFRRTDISAYTNPRAQTSPSLATGTWSDVTTGIAVEDDFYGAGVDRVTVTIPRGSLQSQFIRLAVTMP